VVPPSSMHSGIRVASSLIFSLMLSLRRLSTALWLSRLLRRFSFAIRACLSWGERAAAAVCKAVVVVGGPGSGPAAEVGEVGEFEGALRPTVTEKLLARPGGTGMPPGEMAKAPERADGPRGLEEGCVIGRLEESAPANDPGPLGW